MARYAETASAAWTVNKVRLYFEAQGGPALAAKHLSWTNADQLSVISLLLIDKSPLTLSHIWRKEKEGDEQRCCARNSRLY